LINLPVAAAPIPREQFVESLNRMLGDARQNVGEPSLRIALIGFAALFRCRQLLGPALGLPALPIPAPERKASMESPGASLAV